MTYPLLSILIKFDFYLVYTDYYIFPYAPPLVPIVFPKHQEVSSAYLLGLTHVSSTTCTNIPVFAVAELNVLSASKPLNTVTANTFLNVPIHQSVLPQQTTAAVRLADASMAPIYNKEDILVFANINTPKHNDSVLVTVAGLPEVLIRKYHVDSANPEKISIKLVPYNADWVTVTLHKDQNYTVHGVLLNTHKIVF